RTVVGICPRLVERVRELFVCISHLRPKHSVCADHRVGNIVAVGPGDCCSTVTMRVCGAKLKLSIFTSAGAAGGWSFAWRLGDPADKSIAITTGITKLETHACFFIISLSFSELISLPALLLVRTV